MRVICRGTATEALPKRRLKRGKMYAVQVRVAPHVVHMSVCGSSACSPSLLFASSCTERLGELIHRRSECRDTALATGAGNGELYPMHMFVRQDARAVASSCPCMWCMRMG